MTRRILSYLLIIIVAGFVLAPRQGLAAAPVVLSADKAGQSLAGRMDVLEDRGGRLGIADVTAPAPAHEAEFKALPGSLAAGYSRSAFWLRFSLLRQTGGSGDRLLEVDMPYLDHVDLYSPDGRGGFQVVKTGDRLPFATRPTAHRNFVFRLALPEGQAQTFYLRVETTSTVVVSAKVWEPSAFAEAAADEGVFLGLAHGAALAIILFAIVQYLTTRQPVYGYFTLYAFFVELTFAGINGYTAQFLFPTMPAISDALVSLGACTVVGSGLFLSSPILDVARRAPWLHRSYRILGTLAYAASAAVFIDQYRLVAAPVQLAGAYVGVAQLVLAARMVARGEREGLIYMAAFGTQIAAFLVLVLRNIGVLASFEAIEPMVQAGGVLQMVLLSVALAQRVAAVERGRHAAEAALLEASRRHQRELENRVAERTAALSAANQGLAAEVVERQATEARLRESEAHLRALLDAAPFPMLVTGMADGRLLFLNEPAEHLLDLGPGGGIDRPVTEFYADPGEHPGLVARLEKDGIITGAELLIRRRDGKRRWALMSAVRFRYAGDDSAMVCLNDISVRKELERTLADAHERSEIALGAQSRAMREQRNFLSMVSHEFRTPLSIIGAAADVLELPSGNAARTRADELAKIRRAILRLTGLMDACLTDEWLDTTIGGLRLQTVDLGRLLADVRDEFAQVVRQSLRLSLPAEAVGIDGDPVLLRVLFSNLVDNAVKYSPSTGEVRITVTADAERAAVTVADDGPGIAAADRERVFEKFYRAQAAAGRAGAGLGLHLVRRIVERHHGEVTLDGSGGIGTGAAFTVRLPRRQAADAHWNDSAHGKEMWEIV